MTPAPKLSGRVWLVHGFNVSDDGKNTVGRLAPFFGDRGFRVKRFAYGWTGLLGVRFGNDRHATMLADVIEPGDVVVGHSNGCCLGYLAAQKRAPIAQLVLINPALDRGAPFAPQVGRIHVWHSPSDTPVTFARFLPWHNWGDMGAVGYRGRYDPRVENYDKEFGFPVSSSHHSDVFTGERLRFFAPRIVERVLETSAPDWPRTASRPPVALDSGTEINHPV